MSLELHIDRKPGDAAWSVSWSSGAWAGAASPAPALNAYQNAGHIVVAYDGGSVDDTGTLLDGVTYSYRCRIYDNVALTYTAYSNTSFVIFATTLIAIERKADAGEYAEVKVERWAATPWSDPGPFTDSVLYTYKARTYDTATFTYSDYGDEDSVTYADPSASAAYYYAMLSRE